MIATVIEKICARHGLTPRDDWAEIVAGVVDGYAERLSLSSREVLERALTSPDFERLLLSALTVNESHFMRHNTHYATCAESVRELALRRKGPLHIWSAGCSRGEEGFSILLTLRERLDEEVFRRVHLTGTDISTEAIDVAQSGVYSRWSLRGLCETDVERYFRPIGDRFSLREQFRNQTRFSADSIATEAARLQPESVAAIFFRNVSIYLTPAAVEEIYTQFSRLLVPSGLLFVAPTDRRPPGRLFERRDEGETSVFRKKSASASAAPPSVIPESGVRNKNRTTRPVFSHPPRRREVRVKWDSAMALRTPRSDIEVGVELLGREDPSEAVDHFRRAAFEHPEDPLVRYWYALSLASLGVPQRCAGQLGALRGLLKSRKSDELLSDGSTTASELLRAAGELEEHL